MMLPLPAIPSTKQRNVPAEEQPKTYWKKLAVGSPPTKPAERSSLHPTDQAVDPKVQFHPVVIQLEVTLLDWRAVSIGAAQRVPGTRDWLAFRAGVGLPTPGTAKLKIDTGGPGSDASKS